MIGKSARKAMAVVLSAAMAFSGMMISEGDASAAAKPALASKKGTVDVGKTVNVKIKNVKKKQVKKLTVKSSDKKVATAKVKGKTAFKVTGVAGGKATITAKLKLNQPIKKKKAYKLTYKATVRDAAPVQSEQPSAAPTVAPSVAPTVAPATLVTVTEFAKLAEALTAMQAAGGAVNFTSQEQGSFEIPAGVYTNVNLTIDAPKMTLTNNAVFKSITIKSIAMNSFVECATGNTIIADNASPIHVIVKSGVLNSLVFKGAATAQSLVEIIGGTLSSLQFISNSPAKVVTKGSGSVGSLTVNAAGAAVAVEASETSKIETLDVQQGTVDVAVNGSAKLTNLVVEGTSQVNLGGTSSAPITVDLTKAAKGAKVTIAPGTTSVTIKVDKNNAAAQRAMIEDKSGKANIVEVVPGTTPTSAPVASSSPSGGGGGGGGGGKTSPAPKPSVKPSSSPVEPSVAPAKKSITLTASMTAGQTAGSETKITVALNVATAGLASKFSLLDGNEDEVALAAQDPVVTSDEGAHYVITAASALTPGETYTVVLSDLDSATYDPTGATATVTATKLALDLKVTSNGSQGKEYVIGKTLTAQAYAGEEAITTGTNIYTWTVTYPDGKTKSSQGATYTMVEGDFGSTLAVSVETDCARVTPTYMSVPVAYADGSAVYVCDEINDSDPQVRNLPAVTLTDADLSTDEGKEAALAEAKELLGQKIFTVVGKTGNIAVDTAVDEEGWSLPDGVTELSAGVNTMEVTLTPEDLLSLQIVSDADIVVHATVTVVGEDALKYSTVVKNSTAHTGDTDITVNWAEGYDETEGSGKEIIISGSKSALTSAGITIDVTLSEAENDFKASLASSFTPEITSSTDEAVATITIPGLSISDNMTVYMRSGSDGDTLATLGITFIDTDAHVISSYSLPSVTSDGGSYGDANPFENIEMPTYLTATMVDESVVRFDIPADSWTITTPGSQTISIDDWDDNLETLDAGTYTCTPIFGEDGVDIGDYTESDAAAAARPTQTVTIAQKQVSVESATLVDATTIDVVLDTGVTGLNAASQFSVAVQGGSAVEISSVAPTVIEGQADETGFYYTLTFAAGVLEAGNKYVVKVGTLPDGNYMAALGEEGVVVIFKEEITITSVAADIENNALKVTLDDDIDDAAEGNFKITFGNAVITDFTLSGPTSHVYTLTLTGEGNVLQAGTYTVGLVFDDEDVYEYDEPADPADTQVTITGYSITDVATIITNTSAVGVMATLDAVPEEFDGLTADQLKAKFSLGKLNDAHTSVTPVTIASVVAEDEKFSIFSDADLEAGVTYTVSLVLTDAVDSSDWDDTLCTISPYTKMSLSGMEAVSTSTETSTVSVFIDTDLTDYFNTADGWVKVTKGDGDTDLISSVTGEWDGDQGLFVVTATLSEPLEVATYHATLSVPEDFEQPEDDWLMVDPAGETVDMTMTQADVDGLVAANMAAELAAAYTLAPMEVNVTVDIDADDTTKEAAVVEKIKDNIDDAICLIAQGAVTSESPAAGKYSVSDVSGILEDEGEYYCSLKIQFSNAEGAVQRPVRLPVAGEATYLYQLATPTLKDSEPTPEIKIVEGGPKLILGITPAGANEGVDGLTYDITITKVIEGEPVIVGNIIGVTADELDDLANTGMTISIEEEQSIEDGDACTVSVSVSTTEEGYEDSGNATVNVIADEPN